MRKTHSHTLHHVPCNVHATFMPHSMPHACNIHPPTSDDVVMRADVYRTINFVPCDVHATFIHHQTMMYTCVLMCTAHSMPSHAMSMQHSCHIHPPNDDVLMRADVYCTFNVVPCNVHATFMQHSSTKR